MLTTEKISMKRKRTSNFCPQEETLLVQLVEASKHIIENKRTDSATIRQKAAEWDNIASKFTQEGYIRTGEQLRAKYDNKKKIVRHKLKQEDGEPLTASEEIVLNLIKVDPDGLMNSVDSDSFELPLKVELEEHSTSKDSFKDNVCENSPSSPNLRVDAIGSKSSNTFATVPTRGKKPDVLPEYIRLIEQKISNLKDENERHEELHLLAIEDIMIERRHKAELHRLRIEDIKLERERRNS